MRSYPMGDGAKIPAKPRNWHRRILPATVTTVSTTADLPQSSVPGHDDIDSNAESDRQQKLLELHFGCFWWKKENRGRGGQMSLLRDDLRSGSHK